MAKSNEQDLQDIHNQGEKDARDRTFDKPNSGLDLFMENDREKIADMIKENDAYRSGHQNGVKNR